MVKQSRLPDDLLGEPGYQNSFPLQFPTTHMHIHAHSLPQQREQTVYNLYYQEYFYVEDPERQKYLDVGCK